MKRFRILQNQDGFMLPGLISFIIAISILGAAVITVILNNFYVVGNNVTSQKAFNISEAGLNYYLWHLSHNATDFKDGQATSGTDATLGNGPFVHDYIDDSGKKQGTFTLWIKPQGNGSTIASVRSIGKVTGSTITRTTEAKIGAASFASYGLLSDTALYFTGSASGPVFSNQGIRMDGPSTDTVGAANATYVPPANLGGNGLTSYPGVWCNSNVTAPVDCNTRDKTNWLFPQTAVDFNQVSGSLCTMKKVAFADNIATASLATQTNACTQVPTTRTSSYLPRRASVFNIARGYLIQLNANNTYTLFQVNGENDSLTPYTSALTLSQVAANIAIPSSGVIFAEDNVWVRTATTFAGRVSIGAGRLSNGDSANITIADDILYSTKNGSDAIGLVSENDVLVAPYAPPASGNFTFEVNAAVLAQSGSVRYPEDYRSNGRCTRGWVGSNQKQIFYGSVSSRQVTAWKIIYGSSCPDTAYDSATSRYYSGFKNTDTQYDYNLLYGPPPSYPITGGYSILSWREVLTRP
jgi:hypothetical protein